MSKKTMWVLVIVLAALSAAVWWSGQRAAPAAASAAGGRLLPGVDLATVRAVLPAGEMQFEAPPNLMAAVIYGPQPLAAQIAAGTLRFTGDPARGQAFVDRFRLGPV